MERKIFEVLNTVTVYNLKKILNVSESYIAQLLSYVRTSAWGEKRSGIVINSNV